MYKTIHVNETNPPEKTGTIWHEEGFLYINFLMVGDIDSDLRASSISTPEKFKEDFAYARKNHNKKYETYINKEMNLHDWSMLANLQAKLSRWDTEVDSFFVYDNEESEKNAKLWVRIAEFIYDKFDVSIQSKKGRINKAYYNLVLKAKKRLRYGDRNTKESNCNVKRRYKSLR